MIVGTGLSHALCFEKKFEVAVVGKIPKGYLMHPNCDRKYYIDSVIPCFVLFSSNLAN